VAEIKSAIEQLSFEERAKLATWLHGPPWRVRPVADWNDDEWTRLRQGYGVAHEQISYDLAC